MALLGSNAMFLGGSVGRVYGNGTTIASGYRKEAISGTGSKLNWSAGWHTVSGVSDRTSIPDGARPPICWTMARKDGGLSSHNLLTVTLTPGPSLAVGGVAAEGVVAVTFTLPNAAGDLISSAVGSTTFTLSTSAGLVGVVEAVGATTTTFTLTGAIGALAGIFGDALATLSASATVEAIGNLEGAITPYTELSPQSLAQAVWAAIAADNHDAGTMGDLLYSAGGGSSPELIAQAVWDALTSASNTSGSMGEALQNGAVDAQAIADAVWNALAASYTTTGTTGASLTAATSATSSVATSETASTSRRR